MDHPRGVRGPERVRDARRRRDGLGEGDRPPREAGGERLALEPFHGEEAALAGDVAVREVADDRGVAQRGEHPRLPREAIPDLGRAIVEQLDRDRRAVRPIAGAEHCPHPPGARQLQEIEAPRDAGPWRHPGQRIGSARSPSSGVGNLPARARAAPASAWRTVPGSARDLRAARCRLSSEQPARRRRERSRRTSPMWRGPDHGLQFREAPFAALHRRSTRRGPLHHGRTRRRHGAARRTGWERTPLHM